MVDSTPGMRMLGIGLALMSDDWYNASLVEDWLERERLGQFDG